MPQYGPPLDKHRGLADILGEGLRSKPDDVALISLESQWCWNELEAASTRLAAGYLALGFRPGDRVASLMPNRTGLLIHFLACFKSGLVAVPLNYRYMPPEIDHALEVSGAVALLAHIERVDDIAPDKSVGGRNLTLITYGARDRSGSRFEALVETDSAGTTFPAHADTDPAAIFFTSGSTGPAKGATHSRGSLGVMMASIAAGFELTPEDIMLPASSMSHLGGFIFSFGAFTAGARVVVARNYGPDEVLPLLRRTRPSVLCILPAALFRVVRDADAGREDFASLRVCRSGSDKVPAELEKEFYALTGMQIDEGYGSSEVGLITLNPPFGVIKDGSIGKPMPGMATAIRNDRGDEVPAGVDGRFWVRTDSLMLGYWGNPDASREVVRDGWFDTGDLVYADDGGYLFFRGRKKQIIVHDGSNICPQEVEEALAEHQSVELAGVVGVRDLLHGEDVVAYVTIRDGHTRPESRDLIAFARDRVGYKAPEEIRFLESMPLNPTGKIDRVSLKGMAADRSSGTHA